MTAVEKLGAPSASPDHLGERVREGFNRGVVPRDERIEQPRRQQRDVDLVQTFGAGEEFAERLGAFGGASHVVEKFAEAAFVARGAEFMGPIGQRGQAQGRPVRADEMILS